MRDRLAIFPAELDLERDIVADGYKVQIDKIHNIISNYLFLNLSKEASSTTI